MSIATDEAEEVYTRSAPFAATRENNICRRTGYEAGRTAAVTETETSAAAIALWKIDANMASLNPTDDDYMSAWLALSPPVRGTYLVRAGMALEAARKAVAE